MKLRKKSNHDIVVDAMGYAEFSALALRIATDTQGGPDCAFTFRGLLVTQDADGTYYIGRRPAKSFSVGDLMLTYPDGNMTTAPLQAVLAEFELFAAEAGSAAHADAPEVLPWRVVPAGVFGRCDIMVGWRSIAVASIESASQIVAEHNATIKIATTLQCADPEMIKKWQVRMDDYEERYGKSDSRPAIFYAKEEIAELRILLDAILGICPARGAVPCGEPAQGVTGSGTECAKTRSSPTRSYP